MSDLKFKFLLLGFFFFVGIHECDCSFPPPAIRVKHKIPFLLLYFPTEQEENSIIFMQLSRHIHICVHGWFWLFLQPPPVMLVGFGWLSLFCLLLLFFSCAVAISCVIYATHESRVYTWWRVRCVPDYDRLLTRLSTLYYGNRKYYHVHLLTAKERKRVM